MSDRITEAGYPMSEDARLMQLMEAERRRAKIRETECKGDKIDTVRGNTAGVILKDEPLKAAPKHTHAKEAHTPPSKTAEDLIAERESTHGSFANNSRITLRLLSVVQEELNDIYGSQSRVQSSAWGMPEISLGTGMILHKLSRAIAGNPHELDHWRDIAGYATLIVEAIKSKGRRA